MDYKEIVNRVKIELRIYDGKLLARANVDLVDPPIIIKGFTVRRNMTSSQLYVYAPAYMSLKKMCPLIWMPKDLFVLLSDKILEEYSKKTGEITGQEEVDIDEIEY